MKPLTRAAVWHLNIVLRRSAERMEKRRQIRQDNEPDNDAMQLAAAVADLCDDLAVLA